VIFICLICLSRGGNIKAFFEENHMVFGRHYMSRSRRKSPVIAITAARSEKQDKRWFNRVLRRRTRQSIHQRNDILPVKNEILTTWDMAKDGKHRFNSRLNFKLMRK
jgi:hypothetical protein